MGLDQTLQLYLKHIEPYIDNVQFCKAGDQRVLASMNDFARIAKWELEEMHINLVNVRANETPMGLIGYEFPKNAFFDLADKMTP